MGSDTITLNRSIRRSEFKQIYQLYFNSLCAFAYRYVQDISLVEDLVQETFIAFWEKRSGFTELQAIRSYLYTSVRNKCLNHLKHVEVQQKHKSTLQYQLEQEPSFQQHVIEEETFNNLFQEIKNLPDAAREIMLLALNGLKNPEIAEELNISVNTVKTQKKIAYSKLKSKLKASEYAVLLTL